MCKWADWGMKMRRNRMDPRAWMAFADTSKIENTGWRQKGLELSKCLTEDSVVYETSLKARVLKDWSPGG